MPIYQVERADYYIVEFEAEDMKDAERRINEDNNDYFLNSGEFSASEFGIIEKV